MTFFRGPGPGDQYRIGGRSRAWRYAAYCGIVGSALVLVLGAGQSPQQTVPAISTASPPQSRTPIQSPAGAAQTPMDVPLRLLAEARQSYQAVNDYACLFIKRERIRGQLQPENLIVMRVRTQPFSVYMRWVRPTNLAGQEACYVAGRNNGMMRVHSTGIIGAVGFVSLDPRDPRAVENSRHTITEAGIGNLIERFSQRWDVESRLNQTQVRIAEYEYDKRRCVRVETTHPDNSSRQFSFYRSVIYFDKQTHLPIRVENYDWPRQGGEPNGALIENYNYADLRLNVGLTDAVFNH